MNWQGWMSSALTAVFLLWAIWRFRLTTVFLKALIRPPRLPNIRVVDPNAPCFACGSRNGRIIAVTLPTGTQALMHKCNVCKAEFYEPPVTNVRFGFQAVAAAQVAETAKTPDKK